jgi:hypothetical protein
MKTGVNYLLLTATRVAQQHNQKTFLCFHANVFDIYTIESAHM